MEVLLVRDVPGVWLAHEQNGGDDSVNSDGLAENDPMSLVIFKQTYEMIFCAVILGVLIDEPRIEAPEMRIPLLKLDKKITYSPDPRIEKNMEKAIPR